MRLLDLSRLMVVCVTIFASSCAKKATDATAARTAATRPATQAVRIDPETEAIELRVLVASLSAFDPQARQDAKQELLSIGKPAVNLLEDLLQTTPDPEARRLAMEILDALDVPDRIGERWEATKVSLNFENAPARQVYESVYRQAGVARVPRGRWEPFHRRLAWLRAGNEPVTVKLDGVSFWQAILALEKQTGLMMTVDMVGRAVLERAAPRHPLREPLPRPPVLIHGPFMIVADEQASDGRFRTLTVFMEPKLNVAPASIEVQVDEALDEAGRVVEPAFTPEAKLDRDPRRHATGGIADVLFVDLPPRPPVAYLKGVIRAKLVSPHETTEVIKQLKDGKLHWNDGRGLVVSVTKLLGDYPVKVRLTSGESPERIRFTSAMLEDAGGNPLEHHYVTLETPRAGDATWRTLFRRPDAVGPPVKLTLQIPREPRTVEIPFEFGRRPAVAPPPAQAAAPGRKTDPNRRITLQLRNAPPDEVYAALFKQADARVRLYPDDLFERMKTPRVTIDFKDATFWEAVDELERQTHLTIQAYGRECILAATDPARREAMAKWPVSRIGAYKVLAKGFGPRSRVYQLQVFVEPRVRVLAHAYVAEIERAIEMPPAAAEQPAFAGVPFALRKEPARRKSPTHAPPRPPMPAGAMFGDMDRRETQIFDVALPQELPAQPLQYLKGYVRAKVVSEAKRIEVEALDIADNAERLIDGRRCIVKLTRDEAGRYTVMLSELDIDPRNPAFVDALPWLVDDKGNAIGSGGYGRAGGDRRVDLTWHFQPGERFGKPVKLLLEVPTQTVEERIPFEFGQPPK